MKTKTATTHRTLPIENPAGASGFIDHMTLEELKSCSGVEGFDGRCPACGFFHLSKPEYTGWRQLGIRESEQYQQLLQRLEEKV